MRLIDADEVKRFYEEDFPTIDNGVHWSRNDIIMNLSNIPTVNAIPIDYIKGKIDDYGYIAHRSTPKIADAYYNSIRELENLIRDYKTFGKQWEREKERKEKENA